MLLPIKWLKQFVTVTESTEDVAQRFVNLGFESEGISNDIVDLDITPNRGDTLSIIGLAREYAASTEQTILQPKLADLTFSQPLPNFELKAEPNAYHRLSAVIIKNVVNQPSPAWLKEAVESVGMNSIDLIVDLTNYVMFELGIPMHAFDLDQLPAHNFQIRLSEKGEQFVSLKDENRELPEEAIIVECNGEIVDLLGIRGGKSTMIRPETSNILVWAVSVPRPLIRRASKILGIRTEGAYRHERETDWEMVPKAVARFVSLLQDASPSRVEGAIDQAASQLTPKTIDLNYDKVNQLLGITLSSREVDEALFRLGFHVDKGAVTVPSWRYFDCNFPEDLVEEVARLFGYNRLPRTVIQPTPKITDTAFGRVESLKDQLVAGGMTEVFTESFSGRSEAEILNWQSENLAVLANPVNRDFAYCRPAIVPNLIRILGLNSWSDDARIFEIGNAFPSKDKEETHLALAAYGNQIKLFSQWVPEESIQLIQPSDQLAKEFTIRRLVTIAEAPIDQIKLEAGSEYQTPSTSVKYRPVSIYPPIVRDISIIISTDHNPEQISNEIQQRGGEQLILVELFDQFQSDKFGLNRQSLAFHLVYQDLQKTLAAEMVEQNHQAIIDYLINSYQAEIR